MEEDYIHLVGTGTSHQVGVAPALVLRAGAATEDDRVRDLLYNLLSVYLVPLVSHRGFAEGAGAAVQVTALNTGTQ